MNRSTSSSRVAFLVALALVAATLVVGNPHGAYTGSDHGQYQAQVPVPGPLGRQPNGYMPRHPPTQYQNAYTERHPTAHQQQPGLYQDESDLDMVGSDHHYVSAHPGHVSTGYAEPELHDPSYAPAPGPYKRPVAPHYQPTAPVNSLPHQFGPPPPYSAVVDQSHGGVHAGPHSGISPHQLTHGAEGKRAPRFRPYARGVAQDMKPKIEKARTGLKAVGNMIKTKSQEKVHSHKKHGGHHVPNQYTGQPDHQYGSVAQLPLHQQHHH